MATLFITAKNWKQPSCLTVRECLNTLLNNQNEKHPFIKMMFFKHTELPGRGCSSDAVLWEIAKTERGKLRDNLGNYAWSQTPNSFVVYVTLYMLSILWSHTLRSKFSPKGNGTWFPGSAFSFIMTFIRKHAILKDQATIRWHLEWTTMTQKTFFYLNFY